MKYKEGNLYFAKKIKSKISTLGVREWITVYRKYLYLDIENIIREDGINITKNIAKDPFTLNNEFARIRANLCTEPSKEDLLLFAGRCKDEKARDRIKEILRKRL